MTRSELSQIVFKEQSAEETARLRAYYNSVSWQERLRIANYLNSIVYNHPENDPPRLDRTVFRMSSQAEQDNSDVHKKMNYA